MQTFLKLLVAIPLGLIAVAFAVANRQAVTVSLDPFATDVPVFALSGPLFMVIVVGVIAGVVIGGAATWLTQGRHRRAARLARREAQNSRAEVTRLQADLQVETRRTDGAIGAYAALPGQTAA